MNDLPNFEPMFNDGVPAKKPRKKRGPNKKKAVVKAVKKARRKTAGKRLIKAAREAKQIVRGPLPAESYAVIQLLLAMDAKDRAMTIAIAQGVAK